MTSAQLELFKAHAEFRILGGNVVNQKGGSATLDYDTDNDGDIDIAMSTNGYLGIGTVDPSGNLHVVGNIFLIDGNQATNYVLASDANGKGTWTDVNTLVTSSPWTTSSTNISHSDGNVGIGVAAPSANLHVNGNLLMASELLLADGSTAAPSLAFASSENTGLFLQHSAGNMILVTNGSNAMFIDSNGYVGIGTDNPTSSLHLPFDNDAATPVLSFGDGDTGFYESTDDNLRVVIAGNPLMYFNPSGSRVGFGSAPQGVYTFASGLQNDDIVEIAQSHANPTGAALSIRETPAGTEHISLGPHGAATFNEQGENFDFRVEGLTMTHLLYVQGNTDLVAIGTSAPSGNLHVVGNLQVDEHLSILDLSSAPDTQSGNGLLYAVSGNLFFKDTSGNEAQITVGTVSGNLWSLSGSDISYSDGNVGVGDTSPQARFSLLNSGTGNVMTLSSNASSEILSVLNSGNIGINDTNPEATIDMTASSNTVKGLVVRSGAEPLADAFQVLDSAGNERFTVDTSGVESTQVIVNDISGGSRNVTINGSGSIIANSGGSASIRVNGSAAASQYFYLANGGTNKGSFYLTTTDDLILEANANDRHLTVRANSSGLLTLGSTHGSARIDMNYGGSTATFDSNGEIGLGDTTPDAMLEISEEGLVPFMISNGDDADGDFMIVTVSGLVGMGTNTPTGNLHVQGNVQVDEHLSLFDLSSAPQTQTGNGILYSLSGNLYFRDTAGNEAQITNGAEVGTWTVSSTNIYRNTGSVGIGTTSPRVKFEVNGNMIVHDGTLAEPSFAFSTDTDLGFYRKEINTIQFVSNGAAVFDIDNTGIRARTNFGAELDTISASSTTNPAHTFRSDTDTGIGRAAADELSIITGGSEAARVDSTGNIGMGITSIEAKLHLQNVGTGNVFTLNSNAATELLTIDNTGNIGIGVAAPTQSLNIAGNIVASSANTYTLGTSAVTWDNVYAKDYTMISDKRLKSDIRALSPGLEEILKLRPVSYSWKGKAKDKRSYGLIAQEVQQVLSETVNVGDDAKRTMGIHYTNLVPVLIKAIQEQDEMQKAREKTYEERFKRQEAQIQRLEKSLKKLLEN